MLTFTVSYLNTCSWLGSMCLAEFDDSVHMHTTIWSIAESYALHYKSLVYVEWCLDRDSIV